jgi:tripartite-type tricarboxylate transporter receptor subunit TctC
MFKRRFNECGHLPITWWLGLALATGWWASAFAQTGAYPQRPIKVIVPYAVGGATDVLTRVVSDAVSRSIGQPLAIENRAGAGVVVGSQFVSKSSPDGYTLLATTSAHSINPTLFKRLPYDSDKDFEPIAILGQVSFVLLANPQLDVSDVAGLIDLLKKNPGKYSFGSAGLGSPMHVGPELFKTITQTQALHVPYKGESAALNDLLGGHTAFMYASPATSAPHVQAGKLRALAVTSARRSSVLPQVPTLAEKGVLNADTYSWIVLMAPGNTPRELVDQLNREVHKALASPEVRAKMADYGFEVGANLSPVQTRDFIRAEVAKWAPVVRASGAVTD